VACTDAVTGEPTLSRVQIHALQAANCYTCGFRLHDIATGYEGAHEHGRGVGHQQEGDYRDPNQSRVFCVPPL
jgi:hypothetical protein